MNCEKCSWRSANTCKACAQSLKVKKQAHQDKLAMSEIQDYILYQQAQHEQVRFSRAGW